MSHVDIVAELSAADALEEAGDLAGATDRIATAVSAAPGDPKLKALYGRLLYLRKLFRESIQQFDAALAIRPDAATTLYFRARARAMVNDLDGAIADFSRCIELQPASADAYCEIADIHYFRKHWRLAHQAFLRAFDLEPERRLRFADTLAEIERHLPPDA